MKIDLLKNRLHPLFKEHKIEKAILFGSHARVKISQRHFFRQALRKGRVLYESKSLEQ